MPVPMLYLDNHIFFIIMYDYENMDEIYQEPGEHAF